MARKGQEVILVKGRRHSPEQVVRKLREADKLLAEGAEVADVCRRLEVSVQTYQRWRAQYRAMRPEMWCADLRWQLFDRLLGHSVGFFTRSRTGDVMSRINNDVGRIEDVLSTTIFGSVQALITFGTTLAFMLVSDWKLTLVAMVALPLSVIPSRYIGRAS